MHLLKAFPVMNAFATVLAGLCALKCALGYYQYAAFWYTLMFACTAAIFGCAINILFYVQRLHNPAIQ